MIDSYPPASGTVDVTDNLHGHDSRTVKISDLVIDAHLVLLMLHDKACQILEQLGDLVIDSYPPASVVLLTLLKACMVMTLGQFNDLVIDAHLVLLTLLTT